MTHQAWGANNLHFYYDAQGSATGFAYNGAIYTYVKNLQGDVTGILDSAGTVVANYSYDAWGKILSATGSMAQINPLRYRGYYYDTDTGLYYLQSRYYDPQIGRFINADDPGLIISLSQSSPMGTNLFVYCNSNPVNNSDPTGHISPANIIGAIIGTIIGAVGGSFLSRWLADRIGLKGWKRTIFIWGLTAIITATAAVIGYFIGPYVKKVGKKIIQKLISLAKKSKGCCFVSGTTILTDNGDVPIENICVGDLVYAENPDTGEKGLKKVTKTFERKTDTLIHILYGDEEIITTKEHPFWVSEKGWVKAEDLAIEDELKNANNELIKIQTIYVEKLNTPIKVYNFEVEDWHTYFVSESKILVHNKCSFTKKSPSQIEKMLNVKKGTFHREIKGDILKQAKKKIPNLVKKVGNNPDIYLDAAGNIKLVSTKGGKTAIDIAMNIFDFIP